MFTETNKRQIVTREQVMPDEVAGLAARGATMLINNRPDGEVADQPTSAVLEAEAHKHGLAYRYIPVSSGHETAADAEAFRTAINDAEGKVVAFCRTGNRSSALLRLAERDDANQRNDSMAQGNNMSVGDDASRLIRKTIDSVAQFKAMQPDHRIDNGGNPAWQLAAYKYTDNDNPGLCATVPPATFSSEFRLTAGLVEPGRGAPLHDHTGEELMFVAEGRFVVFFDEEETQKVYLEKWDVILVPGNLPRGWRNVSDGVGYFLNFSGTHDRMTTLV
ncbi:TIGR01244 family sulfur transferase [Sphingomonas jeddahensis]|uniref:Beta-lactamase hydrolase-like protein n=1 Tax=Sphingomonas jeddahensis TaxID=1915074 RepID=A0A1V2EY88_9SPHN|nr:TIGR01244 family sulfur transferase [Sphingomonas jeddahensis]ONF97149.1 Beta-lactamase hydrolase-like protein [Sphingomonas jeddahensis]